MSEKDERLCVGWSWAEQNGNEGNVSLTDFSLDVPLAFAGSEIEVTQKMSGEIRLRRNAEGLLNGVADLKLSPGLIRSRSDPDLARNARAQLRAECARWDDRVAFAGHRSGGSSIVQHDCVGGCV